jgi:protein-disulfide isomerase
MKKITAISIFVLTAALATPSFALFGFGHKDKEKKHATKTTSSQTFTPAQVAAIQKITHDYLVQNPKVLVEAGQALQQQAMGQLQQKATKLIHANAEALFNAPNSIVVGNPNGRVTLVEFYDYQCPHCRDTSAALDDVIKANPDLRVIFKNLPIFGKYSQEASGASNAAYALDKSKFMAFHQALMSASVPFNSDTVKQVAAKTGYDYAKLSAMMQSKVVQDSLKANFNLAEALLTPTINMVATPAIVVGPTVGADANNAPVAFIPGQASQQQLQAAIDQVKSGR